MQTPLSILLKEKGQQTHSISPQATIHECVVKLNELGIGALIVMDGEKLKGIISERDLIRKLLARKGDPSTVKVAEIMTSQLITVTPSNTVQEAIRIITGSRIRHLPVLEEDKLVGMISIGDLTKWIMLEQEKEIADLTGYIHGTPPKL